MIRHALMTLTAEPYGAHTSLAVEQTHLGVTSFRLASAKSASS
jgi:hypothetical protein